MKNVAHCKWLKVGSERTWLIVGSATCVLAIGGVAALHLWAVPVRDQNSDAETPMPMSLANDLKRQDDPSQPRTKNSPRPRGAFTLQPSDRTPMPSGSATDVVQTLRPKAEGGDAQAAIGLYLKLGACAQALAEPISNEELEAYRQVDAAEQFLGGRQRLMESCDGAQPFVRERGRWLEQAADSGDLEAQLLYSVDAEAILGQASAMLADPARVDAYKRKASTFLHQQAATGNIDAMLSLAMDYQNGIMQKKDLVTAYAYYRAVALAAPHIAPPQLLGSLSSSLSPSEIKQAERKGHSIYSSCCSR